MPHVDVRGVRLHYIERGTGPQTVVFSHSYLLNHEHFEPQIRALEDRFRIIAYDHREHGQSGAVRAPCTMEDIYEDGVALVEALCDRPVHWVGLSTGGFVGMRIAYRRPELLRSLVLMSTSATAEPGKNHLKNQALLLLLRIVGIQPILRLTMKSLFSREFLHDARFANERKHWERMIAKTDPAGLSRFGHAIFTRTSILQDVTSIRTPTLLIFGDQDLATPPACGRMLRQRIEGAQLHVIAGAAHMTTIEAPDAVNAVLEPFLDALAKSPG